MGRQAVVVNEGMRTKAGSGAEARDAAAQDRREVSAGIYARISALMRGLKPEPPAPKTPHEIVFQSRYRLHRIQIDAPADIIDARGRKTMGRTLFAQFRDGVFSIPKFVKGDNATFMLDVLRSHPRYGMDRDFWEQQDLSHRAEVAKVAKVVELLESNKDIKDTVLDYLTERDFVDPLLADQPTRDDVAAAESADLDTDEESVQPQYDKRPGPDTPPYRRRPGRPAGSKNKHPRP